MIAAICVFTPSAPSDMSEYREADAASFSSHWRPAQAASYVSTWRGCWEVTDVGRVGTALDPSEVVGNRAALGASKVRP